MWAWGSIIADASSIVLRLIVKGGVGLLQSSNGPFGNVDCCVTGGGLPSNTKRPTSKDDCIGGCCVEGGGLFSNTKRPIAKTIVSVDVVWKVVVYFQTPRDPSAKTIVSVDVVWQVWWSNLSAPNSSISKDDCIGGCCVEGGGLFSNTKRPIGKDDCIGGCCVAGVVVYLSAPNSSISKDDCIGGCCVEGGGLFSNTRDPSAKTIVSVDVVWQVWWSIFQHQIALSAKTMVSVDAV